MKKVYCEDCAHLNYNRLIREDLNFCNSKKAWLTETHDNAYTSHSVTQKRIGQINKDNDCKHFKKKPESISGDLTRNKKQSKIKENVKTKT